MKTSKVILLAILALSLALPVITRAEDQNTVAAVSVVTPTQTPVSQDLGMAKPAGLDAGVELSPPTGTISMSNENGIPEVVVRASGAQDEIPLIGAVPIAVGLGAIISLIAIVGLPFFF